MDYQICDVMISISSWVSFDPQLINPSKGNIFLNSWMIWRTGAKFQALVKLATCSNYSVTNYNKFPVFHFLLVKIVKSPYFAISLKSEKALELLSSLQHWIKDMFEMFVIRYTSIWPNFILIVHSIQKK